MASNPRPKRWTRWLKRLALVTALVLLAAAFYCRNYVRTLASLRRAPGGNAYVMDYYADYHLDEVLERGIDVSNIEDSCIETLLPDFILPIATRVKREFVPEPVETMGDAGEHCSTLFIQSSDGTAWLARNQDYGHDAYLILRVHDDQGVASVAVVDLAYLNLNRDDLETTSLLDRIPLLFAPYYAMDGMNRHGVAAGVMSVAGANPPDKPDIFHTLLMRVILDEAASSEEAVALARQFDIHFVSETQHALIADATGDSRIVEYIDDEIRETPVESNWQLCTNFTIDGTDEAARDQSCHRYQRGSDWVASLGPAVGDHDVHAAIRSMSVDNWTMWTSTYNLTTGQFDVTYRSAIDRPFAGRLLRTE